MQYNEEAEKLGLQVSWTKSKFMYVSDGPDSIKRMRQQIAEPKWIYMTFTWLFLHVDHLFAKIQARIWTF